MCASQREKGKKKVPERMNRATFKSFLCCGLDPPPPPSSLLPSPSCDLLMISEKTTTSHPSLVFSFRPSWSSSTPAYGTLLPWGRTTRRPSPVSPFFFFSHLFSLCRFRHSAKPPHSLRLFLFPSLSLSSAMYRSIHLSFFHALGF